MPAGAAGAPSPTSTTSDATPLESEVAAHVQVLPVLSQQLRETAAQVERAVVEVCQSFEEIAALAHRLVERHGPPTSADASGPLAIGTERLASEVRRAVVALQFQDMVTQRIAHVIDALDAMHTALRQRLPAGAGVSNGQALSALSARYTMQAEREVQASHDQELPAQPGSGDQEIELF